MLYRFLLLKLFPSFLIAFRWVSLIVYISLVPFNPVSDALPEPYRSSRSWRWEGKRGVYSRHSFYGEGHASGFPLCTPVEPFPCEERWLVAFPTSGRLGKVAKCCPQKSPASSVVAQLYDNNSHFIGAYMHLCICSYAAPLTCSTLHVLTRSV